MAGHSKWAQIKRKKGVTDAKRGQLFTKPGRELSVAVKQGGPNPDENPNRRPAIDRARQNNMPKDTIERAIERASSAASADTLEEVRYEAYGPGGAAMLVDSLTDNRNRTVAEVRSTLTRAGANMADAGAVAWIFEQKGVVSIDRAADVDADEVALAAIEGGAEDVVVEDELIEVVTAPAELEAVRGAIGATGVPVASAEVVMRPTNTVEVDEQAAGGLLRLIDALEELDDVQRVFTNADFPEAAFVEA